MKICAAQIQSEAGNLTANLQKHLHCIAVAAENKCELIVFPELSLISYEPEIAHKHSLNPTNKSLQALQNAADDKNISICVGAPYKDQNLHIGMFIYQAREAPMVYTKHHLHEDELPYFTEGNHNAIIKLSGLKIVPAICYESLREEHAQQAANNGADIYLASVAKPQGGTEKAYAHYPKIAKQHGMKVLMCNSIGPADNFIAAGKSGYWNEQGKNIAQLTGTEESLLIVDLASDAFQSIAL